RPEGHRDTGEPGADASAAGVPATVSASEWDPVGEDAQDPYDAGRPAEPAGLTPPAFDPSVFEPRQVLPLPAPPAPLRQRAPVRHTLARVGEELVAWFK